MDQVGFLVLPSESYVVLCITINVQVMQYNGVVTFMRTCDCVPLMSVACQLVLDSFLTIIDWEVESGSEASITFSSPLQI